MSDAPERIWVEPPYFTLHGEVPNVVWEPQWPAENAQAFQSVRANGVEYIRADLLAIEVEALRKENERLRSLVFVGYHEGYTEAGGHWRGNSGWNNSETKFALDNPPPSAALHGETE